MRSQIGLVWRGYSAAVLVGTALSFPSIPVTASWQGGAECRHGTWVPAGSGYNCVCPNGAQYQIDTSRGTLQFICPPPKARSQQRAQQPIGKPSGPTQADIAQKERAEKELKEAEQEEERLRSMLNNAEEAEELAAKSLRKANKRADALQKKANATSNPEEKLGLLKDQLELKKVMLPVTKRRDQMQASIARLEDQLDQAKGQTKRARRNLAEANELVRQASRAPGQQSQGASASQGSELPRPAEAGRRYQESRRHQPSSQPAMRQTPRSRESLQKPSTRPDKQSQRYSRSITPVQESLERELLRDYRYDRKSMKVIADNADYATLASAAYEADNQGLAVPGWTRLYTLPYETHDNTGSNAASVFKSDSGKIVVAFEGSTKGDGDWSLKGTNIRTITPWSETGQIDWVRNTSRALARKYGRDITFVGHSLGGRLAQIARFETGANAVVFDTAPLSAKELRQQRTASNLGTLKSFRSPSDQVSRMAVTKQHVEVKNFNSIGADLTFHNHSHEALAHAMQTVKNACTWIKCR